MNRATLHTGIACAFALLAGIAIGGRRPVFPSDESARASGRTAGRTAPPDAANSPLALAVKTETGAKGWLRLVAAAEKATAKDMPGIIRAAGGNYEAVRMLGMHWARLDPRHMFGEIYADFLQPEGAPTALPRRDALMQSLFEEWSKADPVGLVKALSEAPAFQGSDNIRRTAVNSLMKADIETALRAMHDWNINNYSPDMNGVAAWAARDPRHAAELAAKYSRGYAAQEILGRIGKTWADSDPEGGMQFAATLPIGSRAKLGAAIVGGWAEKDLAAAASFTAAQTDVAFRNALAKGLVEPWAKKDPAAALAWSQENLRGEARSEAVGDIVEVAAGKDIAAAGELVASMAPGNTQNSAAASLLHMWSNKGREQRDAAIEWLAILPDKEARRAVFDQVGIDWSNDPAGARAFLTGPHADLASNSMVAQIARREAAKNPEAAMEWAGKLPGDRADAARSAVLNSWLGVRPEAAANYVRSLAASPEREQAINIVTRQFGWQAPDHAAAWILSLADAGQTTALKSLENMPPERRRKIEDAMKKPAK